MATSYSTHSMSVHDLLQPLGGLFTEITKFRPRADEPRLATRVVGLGTLHEVWPHIMKRAGSRRAAIHGSGVGLEEQDAVLPALVEALERYCASVHRPEQFTWATAEELGDHALDLDTIPRCTKTELSHPRCPLIAPDKKAPIRWVKGLSLLDGRVIYLPAVMVYLFTGYASPGERIWIPISTGCAGHTSFERALLGAILEVIERDALSILWLQKLPFPRIALDSVTPLLVKYLERYQQGPRDLEYIFFDATTDLEVPTVYGVQIARENSRLTTLVSCSAAMHPAEAVIKVIRDMSGCRRSLRKPPAPPSDWDDFTELLHGASYMAYAAQAHAFDFLLQSSRKQRLSAMHELESENDQRSLALLLKRLSHKGLAVYAVDLSTDEALRSGVRVVRVLIPGLQPFSGCYLAQYKAHPRLYDAPRQMGYTVRSEEQLNRWPQPFP
jgi:ribosomal protein S12 methylthiotransferase accessory factor